MRSDTNGGPHRRSLADILAAEATAFGSETPSADQIPAGRGTRRGPRRDEKPAVMAEPAAESAPPTQPEPDPAPKQTATETSPFESLFAPRVPSDPDTPDDALDATMVIFPPIPTPRATTAEPEPAASAASAVPAAPLPDTAPEPATASAFATSAKAPDRAGLKDPETGTAVNPDNGGFSGPPRWQEHVPFDETGVLLRPESLRAKAMQAETELLSAIKVEDDDSEAARSQRPGFWTGAWPRRTMLASIMVVQAALSLRNNNSPFEDESLYLYSGHIELGHMLYGSATTMDYWSFFSGAPVLYPPLGALADQIGGIFAARLLSLLFMLGTTGLLYLNTRRLFGTRAGLCAAALYSCSEATVFVGGLATYDAPALFLLALASWIVVRFARNRFPFYLLAILPAALAVGTKYVSLLFVPSIIVLAFLAAVPYSRRWALIRPVALALGTGTALYLAYKLLGSSAAAGITSTTTSRAQGTDSVSVVLKMAGEWGGAVFAVSLIGAVFVVALPRHHAHPAISRSRWLRVALVALLAGTAALVPAYQAHLHTLTSLQKHVGFGLFFAAPLAGYGLVRIVGPHLHRIQLGIGMLVLTFALGMGQSLTLFHGWPNSYAAVAELVKYQKPGANYLFAAGPNVIYQLRGDPYVKPLQISDAFSFNWWTENGTHLTGDAAYRDAIQAGYFQVVVYDFTADEPVELSIAQDLYDSPIYKLAAKIYTPTSYGPAYSYVWVLKE